MGMERMGQNARHTVSPVKDIRRYHHFSFSSEKKGQVSVKCLSNGEEKTMNIFKRYYSHHSKASKLFLESSNLVELHGRGNTTFMISCGSMFGRNFETSHAHVLHKTLVKL